MELHTGLTPLAATSIFFLRKMRLLPYLLLATSFAFANNPNADLAPLMANTATSQMISILPLFVFAAGIAVFFALVQKNPQKAAIGCGGLCAIAFILGFFIWVLNFIASHAFIFILLAVALIFIFLICYMVYSPPSPNRPKNESDETLDKDNPFYEGPR